MFEFSFNFPMSYSSVLWYFDEFAQCARTKYFTMDEFELEGPSDQSPGAFSFAAFLSNREYFYPHFLI